MLVFVASSSNSGSTLLELLVGSHSRAVSCGPLKVLSSEKASSERARVRTAPCTCGAAPVTACAFWRAVDTELRGAVGIGVWEVDLNVRDRVAFREHNGAFVEAVCRVSGASHLVESSKSARRLARLLEAGTLKVKPIQLARDPRGVIHSRVRRGHGCARSAIRYAVRLLEYHRVLAGHDHLRVSYESLTGAPSALLTRVMAWLGLDFEPGQLDWTGHVHHSIAGNAMRFERKPEIRCDMAWREGLSPAQQSLIQALTWPARAIDARVERL